MKQEQPFTVLPNLILDCLPILNLSSSEYTILIKIIRQIYGYQENLTKNSATIGKANFIKCSSIVDRRNVRRSIKSLTAKKIIIQLTAPKNFEESASYSINLETFRSVINKRFQFYPKMSSFVSLHQPSGVGVSQPPIKSNKENKHKENIKEIFPDVLINLSIKTDFSQKQIERLRDEIAKNIGASPESDAVSVYLREQILKTNQQREVKDKFAYTFQSCRNLGRDLKRGVSR